MAAELDPRVALLLDKMACTELVHARKASRAAADERRRRDSMAGTPDERGRVSVGRKELG
jgi:hypothetical protein